MKKPLAIAIVALVAGLVTSTVIWKVTRPETSENAVIVGTVLPLTGPAALLGEGALNGLKLAEEHANTGRWGVLPFQVKVIAEDGAAVPKTSIGAYHKLVDVENARIVVTTVSGVCMALKPLAEQNGVLLFANASHPDITDDARFTLRHSQTAGQEAQAMLDAILKGEPQRGVSIVYENDDYGSAFAQAVRESLDATSVKLLAEAPYERGSADARVLAQRAMTGQPDAVVVLGIGKDLGLIIRRLREYGYAGGIYTGIGFVLVPGAAEAAGEHAVGTIHSDFDFAKDSEAYTQLDGDYRARFGKSIDATALISYNTLKLLCDNIGGPRIDPLAIAEAIRRSNEFHGVGERMSIYPNGDILPFIRLVTFDK
jgi:branched-chain amino acid transport system substrate-binding protein